MKIPALIVGAVITIILGLQTWTLSEVVNLKVSVARLQVQVEVLKITSSAKNH